MFARRDDRAIVDGGVQLFRFDACVIDALHAVGALFHDTAAPHGNFGIAQKLQLRRLPILEAQEIEAPHFVGAIVRAVARSDAAVINHVVQAFGAVHRGADGVLALLAGNGLEECRRIEERLVVGRRVPNCGLELLVIAVDADPVHFAAAHHLILADDWDVVLRLASDHASVATIAFVQVNGHGPFFAVVGKFSFAFVQREFLGWEFRMLVRKIRILAVLLKRSGRENLPAFHVEVILRASERIILAGFFDRAARG